MLPDWGKKEITDSHQFFLLYQFKKLSSNSCFDKNCPRRQHILGEKFGCCFIFLRKIRQALNREERNRMKRKISLRKKLKKLPHRRAGTIIRKEDRRSTKTGLFVRQIKNNLQPYKQRYSQITIQPSIPFNELLPNVDLLYFYSNC